MHWHLLYELEADALYPVKFAEQRVLIFRHLLESMPVHQVIKRGPGDAQ